MSTPSFPPRLHVLLAREAPLGLVIRRGPSRQVCTLLWNLENDTFQLGQWLRGRIYERRSDLSPDGRYLLIFALNGKWQSETRGSWTAISRAPYLKALCLYPNGEAWNGGGLFTSPSTYWLNQGPGLDVPLRDNRELRRDPKFRPVGGVGAECLSVYFPRLLRDGWRLMETRSLAKMNDLYHFEKTAPGGWTLRKLAHAQIGPPPGRGCYWDEHQLIHTPTGHVIAGADWEWADLDVPRHRALWAAGGQLFAATLTDKGPAEPTLLHDFTPMTFEPIQAPY